MQAPLVPQDKAPKPTSSLSITSMIMGVLGWTLVQVVGGIIAVITGHMAKKEIRRSDGLLGGDGIATAGLILGCSNLTIGLCVRSIDRFPGHSRRRMVDR